MKILNVLYEQNVWNLRLTYNIPHLISHMSWVILLLHYYSRCGSWDA